jgi:hypothetical protein
VEFKLQAKTEKLKQLQQTSISFDIMFEEPLAVHPIETSIKTF